MNGQWWCLSCWRDLSWARHSPDKWCVVDFSFRSKLNLHVNTELMPFLFGWVDRRDHRSIRNEAHRWSTRLIEIEDLFGCVFSTLESTKCHQLLYEISIARDASFSPTNYQWQILWCLAVRTNCYRNLARVISKHHIHSCCLSTLLYQGDRDKCRTPTPDETNARSDSIFLSTWTEDFSWTLPCFAPDKRESKKVFIKKLDSIRPNIDHKHTDSTLMTCWMKFFFSFDQLRTMSICVMSINMSNKWC